MKLVPRKDMQNEPLEHVVDSTVPQTMEEILEATQRVPQESIQDRTVELIVAFLVPHISEEIVKVLHMDVDTFSRSGGAEAPCFFSFLGVRESQGACVHRLAVGRQQECGSQRREDDMKIKPGGLGHQLPPRQGKVVAWTDPEDTVGGRECAAESYPVAAGNEQASVVKSLSVAMNDKRFDFASWYCRHPVALACHTAQKEVQDCTTICTAPNESVAAGSLGPLPSRTPFPAYFCHARDPCLVVCAGGGFRVRVQRTYSVD